MNTLRKIIAVTVFLISPIVVAQDPYNISVTIERMESKVGYLGKPQCEFFFSILNNSMGTIDRLRGGLTAWDDRGRTVDELLSANFENSKNVMFGRTSIAVGEKVLDLGDATFKEECEYISKVKFDTVDVDDCAIRMLPENYICNNLIVFKSNLEGISVD